jgi:hypothetical protein
MSIAPYWRDPNDHRWSVAQVHADLDDVVRVILAEGDHQTVPLSGDKSPYRLSSELMVPIMLYRQSNSGWTFVEGLYGVIGCDLQSISSNLTADVLYASFEDNVGGMACALFRNGTLVREYMSGPSEFMDPSSDCYDDRSCDGTARAWQTDKFFTRRLYDATGANIDLENTSFLDYWDALSDELDLEIPRLCWDHNPEASTISADPALNELIQGTARLLDIRTG